MFSGKREKALEEELSAVKELEAKRKKKLLEITERRDDVLEQFARLTASYAQTEKVMDQMEGRMENAVQIAQSSSVAAQDVRNAMIETNNAVGTFEVNHKVFMGQIKAQNEKVKEIVESNKYFTTPVKILSEVPVHMKEENGRMEECVSQMHEYSKSMGVLALNAAIEAGRMGEAGEKFIAAAEEIRTFSENYEKGASELAEQLKKSDEHIAELLDQIQTLSQLMKENNISMGKLLQEGMQQMAAYEAGQLEISGLLPEKLVGRADALQESQKEAASVEEQILAQIGNIREEFAEQKNCTDELENICKEMQQAAGKGIID